MKLLYLICSCFLLLPQIPRAQWKNVAPNLLVKNNPRLPHHGALGAMTYSKGKIWLGYTNGLWTSSDDGKSWSSVPSPVPAGDIISDVDFFDQFNGLICTGGIADKEYDYFLTRDGGSTWKSLPRFSEGLPLQSKFVGDPQRILLADINANLILSVDGGLSFRPIFIKDSVIQTHCVLTRNGSIYALMLLSDMKRARIYSTTNDGLTWSVGQGAFGADSYTFAIDSCDEDLIYIVNENFHSTTAGRLLYSHDAAKSFVETEFRSNNYYAGSIMSTSGGVVYTQTRSADGLLRSTDRGVSWKSIGGPPGIIDSRLICTKDDNTVFAVDSFGSVWATYNSGGDSLTLPFGSGNISGAHTKSEDQARIKPLDTMHIHVIIEFTSASGVTKLFPDSISYLLRFREETIDISQADLPSSILPPPGWSLQHAEIGSGILTVTLRNDSKSALSPIQDFGTVIFRANAAPKELATVVFAGSLQLFAFCRTYKVALGSEDDYLRSVIISLSDVQPEFSQKKTITVYPNPAATAIFIGSPIDLVAARLEIFDGLGRQHILLQNDLYTSHPYSIDISALPDGQYFLRVSAKGFASSSAFTISR